jgi:hypothetical protein
MFFTGACGPLEEEMRIPRVSVDSSNDGIEARTAGHD